ncbi:MAG: hypothetical protein ACRC68_12365 [Clostridium sp.]
MNKLDNGVDVYGVSKNIPMLSNYFKEFDFQVTKEIDEIESDIDKILSVNVNINASDSNIIKTPIMVSNEGSFFSGYKLKVELIIDIKARYILDEEPKTIGFMSDKIFKTIYIVLPLEHKGNNMIDLLRKKKITINTYVEDIDSQVRKLNFISTNISAIVVADLAPN